jgi:hypothetical protein
MLGVRLKNDQAELGKIPTDDPCARRGIVLSRAADGGQAKAASAFLFLSLLCRLLTRYSRFHARESIDETFRVDTGTFNIGDV